MADRIIMFVFPGQGSQYRGMGSDIYAEYAVARDVYAEASDVLGYDMVALSFEDPKDELGLTRFTQPVLLTHSIACLRVFEELTGGSVQPALAAGHSLGEYSALVAAGILTLSDGLRLVQKRGELMGAHGEGGMVALTIDAETAEPVADMHYCQVASCNLPEQTVVGGTDADLERLVAYMGEHFPRKRAIPLATEGAFHTYLMVAAAREFRAVLDATEFAESSIKVLSNYTAGVHDADADGIRTRLFFQLFKPVNWVGCLQTAIAAGVEKFVEFGGGLGKADEPAGKRPNLESIIKKTLKVSGHEADYVAAINLDTLAAARDSAA
ncbi:MAG: ACP S-malonyltransferase [Gammaproteobacteria bacterium]|nr:ACP S-malonyltransferase [Gammaproteobacteria bacterium]MBT8445256.1 ACP S-malonyltransferase [Gammaproteobacteria bacterium]NND35805.1 ACP S-malonyltransferase [Gammaproteobacteria bacterium]